jgi:signal transduction histidine kinase
MKNPKKTKPKKTKPRKTAKRAQSPQPSIAPKAIVQLAGGVGHELGNILLRIMGGVDLAMMETDLEKVRNRLVPVLQATERAALFIRNLQFFSRGELLKKVQPLQPIIQRALTTLKADFVKHKTVGQFLGVHSDVPLLLEGESMHQALCNLLLNGIQASPPGTNVEIELKDAEDQVKLEIRDRGLGLKKDVLAKAFHWGFTTRGNRGAGLGLPIASEIIRFHGGRIEIKQKPTTVIVWLPKPTS